jgi:hypothetical protein
MAVSGIIQAQATQPTTDVLALTAQKTQNSAKAETANNAVTEPQTVAGQGTPGIKLAENHAGQEQGNRQNAGAQGETSSQINLYA